MKKFWLGSMVFMLPYLFQFLWTLILTHLETNLKKREDITRETSIFQKVFDAESMSLLVACFLLDNRQLAAEGTSLFIIFSLVFYFA